MLADCTNGGIKISQENELMMCSSGEWRCVCGDDWTDAHTQVIHRQLGCYKTGLSNDHLIGKYSCAYL